MKKQKCFKQQNNIQNIQRGKGRSRLSNSSNNHPEEKSSKGLHLHGPEWSSAK
jgi:hypothetical protein